MASLGELDIENLQLITYDSHEINDIFCISWDILSIIDIFFQIVDIFVSLQSLFAWWWGVSITGAENRADTCEIVNTTSLLFTLERDTVTRDSQSQCTCRDLYQEHHHLWLQLPCHCSLHKHCFNNNSNSILLLYNNNNNNWGTSNSTLFWVSKSILHMKLI